MITMYWFKNDVKDMIIQLKAVDNKVLMPSSKYLLFKLSCLKGIRADKIGIG